MRPTSDLLRDAFFRAVVFGVFYGTIALLVGLPLASYADAPLTNGLLAGFMTATVGGSVVGALTLVELFGACGKPSTGRTVWAMITASCLGLVGVSLGVFETVYVVGLVEHHTIEAGAANVAKTFDVLDQFASLGLLAVPLMVIPILRLHAPLVLAQTGLAVAWTAVVATTLYLVLEELVWRDAGRGWDHAFHFSAAILAGIVALVLPGMIRLVERLEAPIKKRLFRSSEADLP